MMKYGVHFFLLNSVLTAVLLAQTVVQAPNNPSSTSAKSVAEICGGKESYEQLVGNWRKTSVIGGHLIELTIISPEYTDRQVDATKAYSPEFCAWETTWVGVNISTNGEEDSFADGGGEVRGGSGRLPPQYLARIESLIDHLPGDGHRVPPPERMLLISVHRNDQNVTKVYDTANLPDKIIELIRLTGIRIKVQTPVLQPDKVWPAGQAEISGLWTKHENCGGDICGLIVSPDKSSAVWHDGPNETLEVLQGSTRPESGYFSVSKVLYKIHEFWQPSKVGGYDVNGIFSPDGRYLLVTVGSNERVLFYDTRNWELVTDSRLFPQKLKQYLPFADWRLAIAVKKNGSAAVWDMQSHRRIFPLNGVGLVLSFALSPDGSRIAVYSEPSDADERNQGEWQLDVWNLKDRKKLHEYWPVEWASYPYGDPVWSAGGRWIAAPFKIDFGGDSGIGLWDVETGRYIGSLGLPNRCDASKGLLADGKRLLVRCSVDKKEQVQEWSMEGVEKQLVVGAGLTNQK